MMKHLIALCLLSSTTLGFAKDLSPEAGVAAEMIVSQILSKNLLPESKLVLTAYLKHSSEDGFSMKLANLLCEPSARSIVCELSITGTNLRDNTGEADVFLDLRASMYEGKVRWVKNITRAQ